MIDVLLVLLIIFMLSVVVLQRLAVDIQLPQAESGQTSSVAPIVLSVRPGPTLVLNGRALALGTLEQSLRAVFQDRPEKVLFIDGARALRYQAVIDVFDAARGAGVEVTAILPPDARAP
jgi:biopolymer transport protein ExbD